MTGQAVLAAGFFLALMACQPVAYLLEKWVEHTEAEDQARSRTPDGSTIVDGSYPQALSTPWAGVESPVEQRTPPAHTQSPVGAVDPHLAAPTGLRSPPSPQTPVGACGDPHTAAPAGPNPQQVA